MAALFSMCCCRGWLGTSLLQFWDKNKQVALPFPFLSLFSSDMPLPPSVLRDKDRQTETHQGMSTLPAACPGSDKDADAPSRETERDGVKKGQRGLAGFTEDKNEERE